MTKGDRVNLTEYDESTLAVITSKFPQRKPLFHPGPAVHKISDLPHALPQTVGRESPNFGEKLGEAIGGSLAFLEDSCLNAEQIWHQRDCPLAW